MRKTLLALAGILFVLPSIASLNSQKSPTLIIGGTLNCSTGVVLLSQGVLGRKRFPTAEAALAALVERKYIDTSAASHLEDYLQKTCDKSSSQPNKSEPTLLSKFGPTGLLLQMDLKRRIVEFSLYEADFRGYKTLIDYVETIFRERRCLQIADDCVRCSDGTYYCPRNQKRN